MTVHKKATANEKGLHTSQLEGVRIPYRPLSPLTNQGEQVLPMAQKSGVLNINLILSVAAGTVLPKGENNG